MWCLCWWFVLPPSRIHLGLFLCFLTHFYIFAHFSLVCSFRLHPNILYLVPFLYVRYISLFSLFPLKSGSSSFRSASPLIDRGWITYSEEVSSASLCPISYHPCQYSSTPCSVFPLLKASAIVPGLYFSMLHHGVSHKYLTLHGLIACYFYLYKALVVLEEDKHK